MTILNAFGILLMKIMRRKLAKIGEKWRKSQFNAQLTKNASFLTVP